MACINPNTEEFKIALERTKNPLSAELEVSDPVLYPNIKISDLEEKLINGFLKDFGITVTEYNSLKDDLGKDANTMSDFLTKDIVYEEGQSILPEVAYFAYSMLGKKNSKIRSDLRYLVHSWNKYNERFEFHKNLINEKEGFIKNSDLWKRKIGDLVILDFLTENLKNYYENPVQFKKQMDNKWTSEDFTLFQKIIKFIENFLKNFNIYFLSKKEKVKKLENIGLSIVSEIIDQNYEYFNYGLSEDQVIRSYEESINSDSFAKEIVNYARKNKLILTGSLALRYTGTVWRSIKELIHDIDFVVSYDLSTNNEKDKKIIDKIKYWNKILPKEAAEGYAMDNIEKLEWFKKFKKQYPNFEMMNAFYGMEHKNFESVTIQGIINPEYYSSTGYHEETVKYYVKDPITKKAKEVEKIKKVKHSKGELNEKSGYAIDFFVRLEPHQEEHDRYFKLWKEIFIAKLKMGREKDFKDWKAFIPFLKSSNNYNFFYEGFRHINWKSNNQNNALEIVDYKDRKPIPVIKDLEINNDDCN